MFKADPDCYLDQFSLPIDQSYMHVVLYTVRTHDIAGKSPSEQ